MNQLHNSIFEGQIIEAKNFQNPNRQFKILKSLGKGGEGEVFLAESFNRIESQVPQVALKFHFKQMDIGFLQNLMKYQQQNESSPQGVQSGMIKIFDIFIWNSIQVIVMEVGSINLYSYLKGNILDQETFIILQQLTYSIQFLHHNNIIHRDLKPENYIKVGDKFKLIDFGSVQQKNRLQTPNVGTPLFMAPEVAMGDQGYSSPVDIWSLGCVFFEVVAKQPLCCVNDASELQRLLEQHLTNPSILYDRIEQFIQSNSLKKLIKQMIHPDPQKRIKIEDVQKQLIFQPNFKFAQNRGSIPISNNVNLKLQTKQFFVQKKEADNGLQIKDIVFQISQLKEIQTSQFDTLYSLLQNQFQSFQEKVDKLNEEKFQTPFSNQGLLQNVNQFNEQKMYKQNKELEENLNQIIRRLEDLTQKQSQQNLILQPDLKQEYQKETLLFNKKLEDQLILFQQKIEAQLKENYSSLNEKIETQSGYLSKMLEQMNIQFIETKENLVPVVDLKKQLYILQDRISQLNQNIKDQFKIGLEQEQKPLLQYPQLDQIHTDLSNQLASIQQLIKKTDSQISKKSSDQSSENDKLQQLMEKNYKQLVQISSQKTSSSLESSIKQFSIILEKLKSQLSLIEESTKQSSNQISEIKIQLYQSQEQSALSLIESQKESQIGDFIQQFKKELQLNQLFDWNNFQQQQQLTLDQITKTIENKLQEQFSSINEKMQESQQNQIKESKGDLIKLVKQNLTQIYSLENLQKNLLTQLQSLLPSNEQILISIKSNEQNVQFAKFKTFPKQLEQGLSIVRDVIQSFKEISTQNLGDEKSVQQQNSQKQELNLNPNVVQSEGKKSKKME